MHLLFTYHAFALSPSWGTGLQGYRGREQSPPVPVPVPLGPQGHFLKSLPSEKERFCPSFCP
nr:MAG TPA: hypothetical protein [Caudoviricetes sp.]